MKQSMYCNYCGKELKDGAVFCTSCGNRVPQPEPVAAAPQVQTAPGSQVFVQEQPVIQTQLPVHEPVIQQTYVPQEPVEQPQTFYADPVAPAQDPFTLNQEPIQKPRKKGLSKGKIAAIAIGAVVLVAAVLVVLNFGAIQNFFLRNSSPDQIMKSVEKEEIGQVVNSVTDVYGNLMDSFESGNNAGEGTLRIVLSDDTMAMLQDMLYAQGVDMDLSFLQRIDLNAYYNIQDSMEQVTMGVGLGDVRILTLDMIMDMDRMTLWLGIPELSGEYVEFDFADLGMSSGGMTGVMGMGMLEDLSACLPSEEVVNSLLNKYIGIALDQISKVERSEGTLEAQGVSMDCVCLKSTIDEKTALNMAIAVLKEARNDQQIKTIIQDVASYVAEMSGVPASEVSNVYSQFQESVDIALEELNEQMEYCGEEAIYYYDYLDSNNAVIGRRLSLGEGMPDLYYYTVYNGNEHAFIADLQEVKITGSGTKNGNLTSGTYYLSVNGADMLQIEIINMDEARLEKNEISGTIGLSFTSEFAEMMAYEDMDAYTASMISSLELQLEMDQTANTSVMNLKVLFNEVEMFGIYMDSKLTNGGTITVPSNAIDAMDEEALMYWMMSMDVEGLIQRLEEAGVPYEILEGLMYGMP